MKKLLFQPSLTVIAAIAAAALFSSCSSYGPSFDPYAANSKLEQASFKSVDTGSKIPSAWLKPSQESYRLGPGDELLIEIIGIAGSASTTFVTPDGKLYSQNRAGARVKGMTLPELKQMLEKELAKWYHSPNVSVSLSAVKSQRIWVLGRVVAPGVYPINRPTTVLEAISTAGGLSVASTTSLSSTGRSTAEITTETQEVADLRRAFLIRDGKYVPIDFQGLIREGEMKNNIYVKDGDYIFLPSTASSEVFVMGSVVTPRSIRFNEELSLVAAIASAGGPTKYAHVQHVVIIRGSLTEPQVAVVPYKDIVTGEARNVALKPHDIVWVPKSPWERVDKLVNEILGTFVRTVAVNEGARIAVPGATTVGTSIDVGGTGISVSPP
jgi:protein involved in polysaccharide export with SLBB domain